MPCPLCQTAAACRSGEYPELIATLSESYLILAAEQGCEGWCVLILKDHAEHLDQLPADRAAGLHGDLLRAAGIVRRAFDPVPPRLNYACLGNLVHHIHWHVIPRHASDPDPKSAVWSWPPERQRGSATPARRAELIQLLRAAASSR